jgi:hypothetical protein
MDRTLNGLLHSRKFWLAILAVAQSIALEALGMEPELWLAIDGVLLVLINSIAKEDAAEKSAPLLVNDLEDEVVSD